MRRADLRCTLCAEYRGTLETTSDRGFLPIARLVSGDGSMSWVVNWTQLRCLRCGSSWLFLDDPETVVIGDQHK